MKGAAERRAQRSMEALGLPVAPERYFVTGKFEFYVRDAHRRGRRVATCDRREDAELICEALNSGLIPAVYV